MSFVVGIIISDDCSDDIIKQLRNVYGISLREVNDSSIKNQLDKNQNFFMFSDDENGYFWDNWTPIGRAKWIDMVKNITLEDVGYNKVVEKWEVDFDLKYISFEAQMYIIILKYLKLICNIRNVGLIGFMLNGDDFQYPVFDKKTVELKKLSTEVIYNMDENCIYYFV